MDVFIANAVKKGKTMAKVKNLVTSFGRVIVGEEIDISIPKIGKEIPKSVSGVKAQTIKTGGKLLGYPLGYEVTKKGHLNLIYLVALGKKSSIAFAGEIGFENATNVLNSFCSKAFKQKGMCARAVSIEDLEKNVDSIILLATPQELMSKLIGSFWLASTSSYEEGDNHNFCLDTIENREFGSEPLVDTEGNSFISTSRQICALVKLRVNIRESLERNKLA